MQSTHATFCPSASFRLSPIGNPFAFFNCVKRLDTKKFRTMYSGGSLGRLSFFAFAWMPALLGILVICGESTPRMGADHTAVWLTRLCSPFMHVASVNLTEINHVLRKNGHFFGYGTLGMVFARGWLMFLGTRLRQTWTRLRLVAGGLGIVSTAVIASLDEIHQSFLPNRTACVSDVLLDTSGALLLVTILTACMLLRRHKAFQQLREVRDYRLWSARLGQFERSVLHPTLSRTSVS